MPKSLGSAEEDGFIKIDLGNGFVGGREGAGGEGSAEIVSLRGA